MWEVRSPNLEKKYPGQERDDGTAPNQIGELEYLSRKHSR